MNERPQSLEPLLDLHERDRAAGLMDAPWPPVLPEAADEPPRVAPSRARKKALDWPDALPLRPRPLERFPGSSAASSTHGASPTSRRPRACSRVPRRAGTHARAIGGQPLGTVPSLAAWRRAFTAFGVEPTRYRSAAEALLRRLTKHGRYRASACSSTPATRQRPLPATRRRARPRGRCGRDHGRFAEGGEEYTDLGASTVEHPIAER